MTFKTIGEEVTGFMIFYRGAGGKIEDFNIKINDLPHQHIGNITITWKNGSKLVLKLKKHYDQKRWQEFEIVEEAIVNPAIIIATLNGYTIFHHTDAPLFTWLNEINGWLKNFPSFPNELMK